MLVNSGFRRKTGSFVAEDKGKIGHTYLGLNFLSSYCDSFQSKHFQAFKNSSCKIHASLADLVRFDFTTILDGLRTDPCCFGTGCVGVLFLFCFVTLFRIGQEAEFGLVGESLG